MPTEDNRDSETFAVVLGLKDVPGHFANKYKQDELSKLTRIRNMTELLEKSHTYPELNTVISIFSANYLPALVDKFLEIAPSPHLNDDLQVELELNNAYFQMLWFLRYRLCPYYMKYIRSRKESASKNQVFTRVLTERLLRVAPIWERLGYLHKSPKHWTNCEPGSKWAPPTQALWMIQNNLVSYAKRDDQEDILPQYLRKRLQYQAVRWFEVGKGTQLGIATLPWTMPTESQGQALAKTARRWVHGWLAEWHVCALRSCKKNEEPGFKACSRCGTVKYCSVEHQRIHWREWHKDCCFKTEY